MNRRQFVSQTLASGLVLPLVASNALANESPPTPKSSCVLIPTETAGPFPLDLSENPTFFRSDVREDQQGVRLDLRLRIIGAANCAPMPNVRVNIWHCNANGEYSGYNTAVGKTYLRGYQFTDANGEVAFTTIFPGWYDGRTCHIHFQVYVSSMYAAISQLTFDHDAKNALYAAHADLYPKGPDPLTPSRDNIFSDGYSYQLATLEADPETGGYRSFLEVAVQGEGTLGIGYLEQRAAEYFALGQNTPNPATGRTTIPLEMRTAAAVRLEVWDIGGVKRATLLDEFLSEGTYAVELDADGLGLAAGNYVYQLIVETPHGRYADCKVLTLVR
ncbi:MAG: hypothetical protein N3B17_08615 [Chlorobi bacterium]|nr:hypothetical protein [Chlorobiota bacterium]